MFFWVKSVFLKKYIYKIKLTIWIFFLTFFVEEKKLSCKFRGNLKLALSMNNFTKILKYQLNALKISARYSKKIKINLQLKLIYYKKCRLLNVNIIIPFVGSQKSFDSSWHSFSSSFLALSSIKLNNFFENSSSQLSILTFSVRSLNNVSFFFENSSSRLFISTFSVRSLNNFSLPF